MAMGKRGSLAFDGKKYYRQIPKAVDAIDTLGAGDSFTTAFLLSHQYPLSLLDAVLL